MALDLIPTEEIFWRFVENTYNESCDSHGTYLEGNRLIACQKTMTQAMNIAALNGCVWVNMLQQFMDGSNERPELSFNWELFEQLCMGVGAHMEECRSGLLLCISTYMEDLYHYFEVANKLRQANIRLICAAAEGKKLPEVESEIVMLTKQVLNHPEHEKELT